MKICTECLCEKSLTSFSSNGFGGHRARCKECLSAWAKAHLESENKRKLAWRIANREKVAAISRAWKDENREKARLSVRQWAKRYPEKASVKWQNDRAAKIKGEGFHTVKEIKMIRKWQRDKCAYCRISLRGGGHLDHIKPLSRGGSNEARNLQWLCRRCNLIKGSKDSIDFNREHGRLL